MASSVMLSSSPGIRALHILLKESITALVNEQHEMQVELINTQGIKLYIM